MLPRTDQRSRRSCRLAAVQLPPDLAGAVEAELSGLDGRALERDALELSAAYRDGARDGRPLLRTLGQRRAYLAVRLPATFAAAHAVLEEARARLSVSPRSALDLGAGPGTAAWAAALVWPELERITLMERDPELSAAGRRLATAAQAAALRQAEWQAVELGGAPDLPAHDLIVACFMLGELPERAARSLVEAALSAARVALVIIEPGTPAGFERVRAWRDLALARGSHLLAPCPHGGPCPMSGADWCHFAARVERSALHRRVKGGALGHEDEKYSYLVLAPEAHAPAAARILRHPRLHGGHGELQLCTPGGLERRVVSRKHGEAWRRLRRAGWGDAWPFGPRGD